MLRTMVAFLATMVLLAAAGTASAQEKARESTSWVRKVLWPWPSLFGKKNSAAPEATAAEEAPEKKDKAPSAAQSPGGRRVLAQNAWLRRLEVCDKLREVALRTGDEDLARQADLLEQRVWDTYVLQTGGKSRPIEERILDRHLGLDAAAVGERPIREVVPTGNASGTSPRRKE